MATCYKIAVLSLLFLLYVCNVYSSLETRTHLLMYCPAANFFFWNKLFRISGENWVCPKVLQ